MSDTDAQVPLPDLNAADAPPIDEAAAADAKMRAAELRYRTLVEQIPAITFMAMLGEGKNEISVSPHIEAVLGFSRQEWLENPFLWYTQLHPDDRARLAANARELLVLGLLAVAVLWMGVYPAPFTEIMHASVNDLLRHLAVSKL